MLGFITVVNVFWLILVVSAVHVLEEYFGGFVDMMQKYGPIRAMTKGLFVAVNAVFIFLCILAVVINATIPTYSLSIAALIFINSFIHIGGAVRVKGMPLAQFQQFLSTSRFLSTPTFCIVRQVYSIQASSSCLSLWVLGGWGLPLPLDWQVAEERKAPKRSAT